MSYILDALRKSERERRRGEPQNLHSTPLPQEKARRGAPFWFLLLLILLFLNSLALGGWFLLQGEPATVDTPQDAVEIPNFENLSSTRRARLSPLKLTAHVHATQRPQASFVTLNGERLREGQQAASGLRVVHIERDGVILEDDGKRFRLPIDSR